MKSLKLLLLAAAVAVGLSSCSTIRRTSTDTDVRTTAYSMTVADLDVSPTLATKTYSWSFNPFAFKKVENAKEYVEAQLLEECKADVLVEPRFKVRKSFMNLAGGEVTVTGYPATYKNFHKPSPEELEVIKAVEIEKAKSKNKKRFFFF